MGNIHSMFWHRLSSSSKSRIIYLSSKLRLSGFSSYSFFIILFNLSQFSDLLTFFSSLFIVSLLSLKSLSSAPFKLLFYVSFSDLFIIAWIRRVLTVELKLELGLRSYLETVSIELFEIIPMRSKVSLIKLDFILWSRGLPQA